MANKKTTLELASTGGQQIRTELEAIGKTGDDAFRKIQERAGQASPALDAISTAAQKAQGALGPLGKDLGNVAGALSQLPGVAGAVAGGLTLVATSMLAVAKAQTEQAVTLSRGAAATQLQVERYQEYVAWATRAGVSQEAFTGSLRQFSDAVIASRSGTGELIERLGKLDAGFLSTIQHSGSVDQALQSTIKWIGDASSEFERAQRATAAFGTEGTQLLPVLRQGAAGFSEAVDQARRYNQIIGTDTVEAGVRAHQNLQILGGYLTGPFKGALNGTVDLLDSATGKLLSFGDQILRLLGLQASARAQLGTPGERTVGADVTALDGQIANLRQNLKIAGPAYSRGGPEIEQRIKALKEQRAQQLRILDDLQKPREQLDYNVLAPTPEQLALGARLNEPKKAKGGGGKSEEQRAAEQFYAYLKKAQDDAVQAGLHGEDLLIAKRDEEYQKATDLADKGKVSEADRAKVMLAIWTEYEGKRADLAAKTAAERNRDLQKEADFIDSQTREQVKQQQESFNALVDNLAGGFTDLWVSFAKGGDDAGQHVRDTMLKIGEEIATEFARLAIGQGLAALLGVSYTGGATKGGVLDGINLIAGAGSVASGGGGGGILGSIFGGGGTVAGGFSGADFAASGFGGGLTTVGLLTAGLAAANSGGRFKLTPLSGGLLGLSALRSVAPYLANTAYGSQLLGQLGSGYGSQLFQGALGISGVGTGGVGLVQGPLLQAGGGITPEAASAANAGIGAQAGGVASSLSTLISVVGSLYSLYSSFTATQASLHSLNQATYGDVRSNRAAAIGGYGALAVGAGVGALIGTLVFPGLGTLAGAAVGAAVGQTASSAVNDSVAGATTGGLRAGVDQKKLDATILKALGGKTTEFNFLNFANYDNYKSAIINQLRTLDLLIGGGQGNVLGDLVGIQKLLSPDIEDIFDKIFVGRLNRGTGLGFSRTPTVLGQGLSKAQRQNVNPLRGDIEDWAAFFNQISGEGAGVGGERNRRTAALLFNNVGARAKTPEEAEALLKRAVAAYLGNNLTAALTLTNKQFFGPTGNLTGDVTRADYVTRLEKVLGAFESRLPRGLDPTRVADATLDQYSRATSDRVLRTARNLRAEDYISGATDPTFDGFARSAFGRSTGSLTRGQRRGLASAEAQLSDVIDAVHRAQFASQFGLSADARLATENLGAIQDKIETLHPRQFKKQLPDLISAAQDATQKWADSLTGMIDTLRNLEQASADARISLGATIASLTHSATTGSLYDTEIGRVNANLALAKSGGARAGYYSSLINLEGGRLQARISDLQTDATNRGVFGLAQLNPSVDALRQGLTEAGQSPGRIKRARQALLQQALAEFGSATGDDKVAAGQKSLGLLQSYLDVAGNSRAVRNYGLSVVGQIGAVTGPADAEAKRIDARIKQLQLESAERLKDLGPKLFAAQGDQAKEITKGLADAGFTSDQIAQAVADPTIETAIIQAKQLEKLDKLLQAIVDIRDHGMNQKGDVGTPAPIPGSNNGIKLSAAGQGALDAAFAYSNKRGGSARGTA